MTCCGSTPWLEAGIGRNHLPHCRMLQWQGFLMVGEFRSQMMVTSVHLNEAGHPPTPQNGFSTTSSLIREASHPCLRQGQMFLFRCSEHISATKQGTKFCYSSSDIGCHVTQNQHCFTLQGIGALSGCFTLPHM